ncbi:MAG: TolC family outer membrane protein [Lysobacterales bacterium]|jgi:outer membrane protein
MNLKAKTLQPLLLAAVWISTPAFAVDLVGVYELAVKNDPQLKAAEYRRDATDENKRQAWANLLPSLSGSASLTKGTNDVYIHGSNLSDSDIDTQRWSVDLRQSLYAQKNYEQLRIAKSQASQAEATYNIAYEDFLIRVADGYFGVLTAQDGVIFAEAEEKALKRQYEQAEQRFEVGLTAVTDVHEARAGYDNARARAIVARNNLADAKEVIFELTNQYFDEIKPLQEKLPLVKPLPENPDEWVKIAMQNNPSVIAALKGVDIAHATVKLERSGHYPTLDLVAGYSKFTNNKFLIRNDFQEPIGTVPLTTKDQQWGLQLSVPLYQGGVISSRTRQARYTLDAVNEDLDREQRAVVRQTNNAYRAVIAGIEQVGAFGQALVSAKSALEATQAGFEVGTRTIVDVLIAQQRFFQAQRDNSQARHTYILNHLRLKAAAGVLEESDLHKINDILK